MVELIVHNNGERKTIPAEEGMPLSVALLSAGLVPEMPCGGTGRCRKCVAYASGAFLPPPDAQGRVLTCQTVCDGDGELYLPARRTIRAIRTEGIRPDCPVPPGQSGYAAAVDIGTTTVAARLVDLAEGTFLQPVCTENPQRLLAADVIGRIQAAADGRQEMLTGMIRETVEDLLRRACENARIGVRDLQRIVVTGNTTMLHLFSGRSPKALARAPFRAECLFGFSEEGWTYPPCYGAFVGADIYTAVLASGMCRRTETALLVDLGTNGEIALFHKGVLHCCATAAGPAFEGSGIRCGGSAVDGAVDHVWLEDGETRFSTLGGGEAVCLCGSGLIDLVACLLELELIDETGALEGGVYRLTERVALYQEDVRQVQLAKGAVRAGVESLLQRQGLAAEDVDTLYVAGGFGSFLELQSAARIGLVPPALAERARVIGNAALSGAAMLALDPRQRETAEAECINLAETAEFTDLFMEHMLFE